MVWPSLLLGKEELATDFKICLLKRKSVTAKFCWIWIHLSRVLFRCPAWLENVTVKLQQWDLDQIIFIRTRTIFFRLVSWIKSSFPFCCFFLGRTANEYWLLLKFYNSLKITRQPEIQFTYRRSKSKTHQVPQK